MALLGMWDHDMGKHKRGPKHALKPNIFNTQPPTLIGNSPSPRSKPRACRNGPRVRNPVVSHDKPSTKCLAGYSCAEGHRLPTCMALSPRSRDAMGPDNSGLLDGHSRKAALVVSVLWSCPKLSMMLAMLLCQVP